MKKIGTAVMVALACLGGVVLPASEANAAPSCPSGYVCTWTERNGGGKEYRYARTANHRHAIQSVYFNYGSWNTMFTTKADGRGRVLAAYYTNQRGFRNWDPVNRWTCKSHRDFK